IAPSHASTIHVWSPHVDLSGSFPPDARPPFRPMMTKTCAMELFFGFVKDTSSTRGPFSRVEVSTQADAFAKLEHTPLLSLVTRWYAALAGVEFQLVSVALQCASPIVPPTDPGGG